MKWLIIIHFTDRALDENGRATMIKRFCPNRGGGRKAVKDRQVALKELVKAIREYRKFTDQPLMLRGGDYSGAAQVLNKAIDRVEVTLS